MSVYWWPNHTTGKLLFRNGILAKGPACCCGNCCNIVNVSGSAWLRITFHSYDCPALDGMIVWARNDYSGHPRSYWCSQWETSVEYGICMEGFINIECDTEVESDCMGFYVSSMNVGSDCILTPSVGPIYPTDCECDPFRLEFGPFTFETVLPECGCDCQSGEFTLTVEYEPGVLWAPDDPEWWEC